MTNGRAVPRRATGAVRVEGVSEVTLNYIWRILTFVLHARLVQNPHQVPRLWRVLKDPDVLVELALFILW